MALTNNQRLRRLMKKHGLTRRAVSNLLGVSCRYNKQTYTWVTPTVNCWLAKPELRGRKNKGYNNMSNQMLELLQFKLGDK